MNEIQMKLRLLRDTMAAHGLAAIRLRGIDWFAWATGGGSSAVLLAAENGVGEVFVNDKGAWVLTDAIERPRFRDEEVPGEFEVWARPWEAPRQTDQFVRDHTRGGRIASDRPLIGELGLPPELVSARRRLLSDEIDRYRKLGAEAAQAVTAVLRDARPEWTETELAGRAAQALWARGIEPTLTLAAGRTRLAKYRHPTPKAVPLGDQGMLVVCGRRHGLYANLTRFVFFHEPTAEERNLFDAVASVEAVAFNHSAPGMKLTQVYHALPAAYAAAGFPGEYLKHHQGGITGYLAREVLTTPATEVKIDDQVALAWNPSVPGMKIEDTVLTTRDGLEILTVDREWPTALIDGRARPGLLVRP